MEDLETQLARCLGLKRISDCCQAPLLPGETPMCSDCKEHCGVVDLDKED